MVLFYIMQIIFVNKLTIKNIVIVDQFELLQFVFIIIIIKLHSDRNSSDALTHI